MRILRRRNYKGEVVIFPARVQGKGAEKEVAAMLEYAGASQDFDIVVITRGGGSIEDLWAFNEEVLARAVAACPLPVISAVGHEIDTVLTDYAADQRAETPSAAAELISSLMIEAEQRLEQAESNLLYWTETGIAERRLNLSALHSKMHIIAPERQVEMLGMKLDDLENHLSQTLQTRLHRERTKLAQHSQSLAEHHPRIKISLAHQALGNFQQRFNRATQVDTLKKNEHLLNLHKRLNNSSLKATLRRGFAVLKSTDGAIISSAQIGQNEDQLTAQLNDGAITLKVLK